MEAFNSGTVLELNNRIRGLALGEKIKKRIMQFNSRTVPELNA